MMKIYKNAPHGIVLTDNIEKNCWIDLVKPSNEVMESLSEQFEIPLEFLQAALDIEEKSRIEVEEQIKLLIIDIPMIDNDMPEYEAYNTIPMAIIVTPDVIITVCLQETSILRALTDPKFKNLQLNYKTRFVFTILMRASTRFLTYLYRIEKTSTKIERQLNQTLKNEQLLQLLALSKSLTYFSASLKSTEATVRKLLRGNIVKLYEEDRDLLDDVLIEISQGVEMASSYSAILKATMETYSSVASNNLNVIMKVLAVITIVMAVPEIIFGFYGMNVLDLPLDHFFWFPILISVIGSAIIWIWIKKSKFYK
ncbi:MAG: magnesium transporter CorA family protein [Clostridia bacterium]